MSGLKTSTPDGAVVAYLADARARVDAVLQSWGVRAGEWWQAPVPAAMRYSLLSTGKRLRPTLVFAAAEAVGGGVEVVHAYSLVHDDLPCMDNDGLRRGRATTHRAFDVATAVVAGYHMVALGARVLDAGLAALALAPEARRGIALELFRAAEGRRLPATELEDVHRRKTGALISAACVIGAMAAGAPRATCEALRGYGADVGLAFQIYDDVLDATATSDQLGKTAGKDAADGKSTFVTLLGASAARAEAERLATRAVDRLRQAGLVSATLEGLARYIVTRPN